MPFAHIAMAVEGCGWTHPDYFALMVANVVSWTLIISPTCMHLVLWSGPVGGHPPPPLILDRPCSSLVLCSIQMANQNDFVFSW